MGLSRPLHHDSVHGACPRRVSRHGWALPDQPGLRRGRREEDAEIHTSTPVARVLLDGRRACGVELASGEKVHCDDVVINADFGHAMSTLFDEKALGRYKPSTLRKRKFSCSTFMMYLGLDRTYDAEHHTIVFARNYKRNIEAITQGRASFEDMSLYIRNSCKTDPYGAPPGHSALYILVPVANNTSGIDWQEHKQECAITYFALCANERPMEMSRRTSSSELIVTPEDWERKHSVFLGATFNMSHSWNQMLYLRPHNQFEDVLELLPGGRRHSSRQRPAHHLRVGPHLRKSHLPEI